MASKMIILKSKSSLQHYPSNTGSEFINKLYQKITIQPLSYECALTSIWLKLKPVLFASKQDSLLLLQKDERVITTHEFLPTVENLYKFTLNIIQELQKFSSFIRVERQAGTPGSTFLKISYLNKDFVLVLSPNLSSALGLKQPEGSTFHNPLILQL